MVCAVIAFPETEDVIGVKETVAEYCEKFGDCEVISVTVAVPKQEELEDM